MNPASHNCATCDTDRDQVNRADLMGSYKNSGIANAIAWSTSGVIVALTMALILTSVFSG